MYKQNINRKHHALIPAAVDEDELDATKFAVAALRACRLSIQASCCVSVDRPLPILSSPSLPVKWTPRRSSTSPSLLRFASAGAGAGAEGVDRSAPTASGPPGVATARLRVHGLGFRVQGSSLRFRG